MKHKLILKNKFFDGFPSKIELMPSPYFKDRSVKDGFLQHSYDIRRLSSPFVFKHNGSYYSLILANLGEVSGYFNITDMKSYVRSINIKHDVGFYPRSFATYGEDEEFYHDEELSIEDIHTVPSQKDIWNAPYLEHKNAISFFKLDKFTDSKNNIFFVPDRKNPDIHIYILNDVTYNPLSIIDTINNEPADIPEVLRNKSIMPNLKIEHSSNIQYYIDDVEIEVYWHSIYIGDIFFSKMEFAKPLSMMQPFGKSIGEFDTNIAEVINSNLLNLPYKYISYSQGYRVEPHYLYNKNDKKKNNTIRIIQDIYCDIHDLDTFINPYHRKERNEVLDLYDIHLDINDVESKVLDVFIEYFANSKEVILEMSLPELTIYFLDTSSNEVSRKYLNATINDKYKLYTDALTPNIDMKMASTSYPYILGYMLGKSTAITQSFFKPVYNSKDSIFTSIPNPFGLL